MKTKIIGQERIVRELGRVFDIFSASGCDCWGRQEYDEVYNIYYNDEYICQLSDNPEILINKLNDIIK